ncbi:Cytoplasmic protein nck2 [Desmophyllum pertusum]|uniref:Cytoplasmic protein nck2 n=1 Tax=Desmophyllum pertusum TaxID=174260 RepID=A0A9W9ZB59_9CNID|nr:Cytoplasmic protein nck2 [Desmophyllum pertusum]
MTVKRQWRAASLLLKAGYKEKLFCLNIRIFHLHDETWFWGKITRKFAERKLNDNAADGDFLVRVSETQEGGYSVSMKAPDKIKHFRVLYEDGNFHIGRRSFRTFEELIEHYKRNAINFSDEAG